MTDANKENHPPGTSADDIHDADALPVISVQDFYALLLLQEGGLDVEARVDITEKMDGKESDWVSVAKAMAKEIWSETGYRWM